MDNLSNANKRLLKRLEKLMVSELGFHEVKPIANYGESVYKTWANGPVRKRGTNFVEVYDEGMGEPWVVWGDVIEMDANDPLADWLLKDIREEFKVVNESLKLTDLLKETSLRELQDNWFAELGERLESEIKKKSKKFVEKTHLHSTKKSSFMSGGVYLKVDGFTSGDLTFSSEIYVFEKKGVIEATLETQSAMFKGKNEQRFRWDWKTDDSAIVKEISDWLNTWLQAN